ncbi:hypothetical protein DERP_009435 [Dermatophagoides pteronyssinus]|uniref:Uncharacterized protein n=1 Tax=Dermatophagoides pteronyssinus TaxID=6956 RepID=A0ABQ8IUB3_DERPT|nr:hypothetical protein DERP_009435 [Dermatophagoides pteronyssinus]
MESCPTGDSSSLNVTQLSNINLKSIGFLIILRYVGKCFVLTGSRNGQLVSCCIISSLKSNQKGKNKLKKITLTALIIDLSQAIQFSRKCKPIAICEQHFASRAASRQRIKPAVALSSFANSL